MSPGRHSAAPSAQPLEPSVLIPHPPLWCQHCRGQRPDAQHKDIAVLVIVIADREIRIRRCPNNRDRPLPIARDSAGPAPSASPKIRAIDELGSCRIEGTGKRPHGGIRWRRALYRIGQRNIRSRDRSCHVEHRPGRGCAEHAGHGAARAGWQGRVPAPATPGAPGWLSFTKRGHAPKDTSALTVGASFRAAGGCWVGRSAVWYCQLRGAAA